MRRWICWDGVNIGQWIWWKGGEGSIKMFRQSGLTTVIFSCSWLAIYCHTRQLFESLVSLKITFRLDKGLKWQAADVRTMSLWLNWLCRYFALLIPVFCVPGSCVLCSVCVLNWFCRYFALLIHVFCVLCSVCVSLIGFVDSFRFWSMCSVSYVLCVCVLNWLCL